MKIQFASDLHLEMDANKIFMEKFPLIPSADILILAGDTTYMNPDFLRSNFFNHISSDFKQVYLIPGNHEFYYNRFDIEQVLYDFRLDVRHNVQYLNNSTIYPDENTRIIFSTLWTYISEEKVMAIYNRMTDFHACIFAGKTFSPESQNQAHEISLKYLTSELSKDFQGSTIVVSHHVPYPESYGVYKGELSDAYYVDLTHLMLDNKIDHWIHGHNHWIDQGLTFNNTMIHTNQLGYVYRDHNEAFRRDVVFESKFQPQ
ncbi:MAG: metallophosphoesterase [Cyclobacteriaceae bacterium]